MKHVVRGVLFGLLIGAVAGGIPFGLIGMLSTLSSGHGEPIWMVGLFGFAVAGFYGAIPGGVLGGIVGLIVGLIRRAAANRPPAYPVAMVSPPPSEPAAAPAVPQGHWIGVVGESLETRAEIKSVEPFHDVFAEKDLRWRHRLVTPQGHALRWLSNSNRGLVAGDRIVLRGTVKDHTWADGESVTEVWYCQARKDASGWPSSHSAWSAGKWTREKFEEQRQRMIAADERRAQELKERLQTSTTGSAETAPATAPSAAFAQAPTETLDEVLAELDALPGLESVAGQVRTLANRVRLNKEREKRGMAVSEVGMHSVFIGPPGTGKTTVARIWGRVLAATGLLPSGHVIETDRSGLVGQHVGETAQKTTAVIDRAKGGVLFVDEAYSLTPGGPASNDFGSEAVDVLLKRMEDERDSFCVIVAGYPLEMERFLESNTGLRSRFAQTMTFPNYSASALETIFKKMAANADYTVDPEGQQLLSVSLTKLADAPPPGWANARSLRALLSAMVDTQSERLAHARDLGSEDLGLLSAEDVRAALEKLFPSAVR
ncbi:AAA family ATPase [Brevibacterium renqingii]|uniref:AAA family ATPase n=1 Tax=Brevibacterium renqingii TaxID=2776916 RepID=UPI001AE006C6|nr:AAA family ATPase [Brevibacterium renqingii]